MEAITNWLEFSAAASQDITDEQYQGMFGSGGARRSTDMASCNPDMSFHHLQPAFNGAVVGANSKSVKSTKQTNILDNDKGKETSSSSHFEHQPGKAIFSAFKYNIMEAMYNKKHTGNEEVLNNMFSAPDMEISQDLAGYLENNSVIGSATAIQPITTAPEHCLALREPPSISSDQDPSTYDDGRVPENGKKPNLDQAIVAVQQAPSKKSLAGSGNRTSMFRGVTKHRWTGRYEGHLWDNTEKRDGQSRRGRQVYLGGYDNEVKAAKAYDLASLKYWGPSAPTNFPVTNYSKDLEEMKQKTNQEYVTILRRRSSGFSRGASSYRGVTRHHQHGRWQARIGRVAGNRDLYLGTYGSQEEAAEVYDIATIKYRGKSAVTNFDINRYDVEKIISNPLPIGGFAKRLRILEEESDRERSLHGPKSEEESTLSSQAESTIYGNAAAAFTASNERPQMGFKQDENPWMKSLQERAQWLQHANDSHILKFLMQQRHASYEKSLQQSMLTPNGSNLQCNPMGFNSPAAINGETGIYNNMSGNFSVNGFPLDNSFPPATSNYAALAHFNNITSNGSVTSMALAHENLFQHPSCLSGPGYEILTGNNGMTAQVLQPQAPAPGMNNRTL